MQLFSRKMGPWELDFVSIMKRVVLYVVAHTETRNFKPLVHEGEAIALVGAVSWLQNQGHQKVLIEVDCQQVANNINKDCSEYEEIIQQCKTLLKYTPNFKVCFIQRQTNRVAQQRI